MNIRQLKKQYKRKHGINPPKGYSRAQIRKGIKSSLLSENIKRNAFVIFRSIERIVYAIQECRKAKAESEETNKRDII